MRLVLVRHAQTDHNRDGFAQGRADNPLNEVGRAQSLALARALTPEPLSAIFSSPLVRAMATAEAIAAQHPALVVREEPDLTEMDVGEMDGVDLSELRQRYPDFLRAWAVDASRTPMPGGESLEQVQERAWRAVERMAAEQPDGVVAAVSHNFVILSLICRALPIDLSGFRALRHDVAAYSVIDLLPNRVIVRKLNLAIDTGDGLLPAPRRFGR